MNERPTTTPAVIALQPARSESNASMALTSGRGATAPRSGDVYLQGELSATVPLSARSNLAVGARGAFLSRPLLNQPEDQWVAFLSYVVQLPLLR